MYLASGPSFSSTAARASFTSGSVLNTMESPWNSNTPGWLLMRLTTPSLARWATFSMSCLAAPVLRALCTMSPMRARSELASTPARKSLRSCVRGSGAMTLAAASSARACVTTLFST